MADEITLHPKIKDLPAGIGLLAMMEQVEQGLKPNKELSLLAFSDEGGFSWESSTQGWKFWADVYHKYKPTTEIPK